MLTDCDSRPRSKIDLMSISNDTVADAIPEWLCLAVLSMLVAVPFLFPFVAGPSANVWQLLASWSCVALLLIATPIALPGRCVLLWLGLSAVAIGLSAGAQWTPRLAAMAAMAVIAAAAAVGAGGARSAVATRRALAWGLLGAGLVSAVLGLLQYYQLAAPLEPWTTAPELGQAYGNLRQRNQFATLINMALIAGLWLYAASDPPSRRVRWALAWAAMLLMLAAAASTSRTGLLQWLMVIGVASWMAWRERRRARRAFPATSPALRLPHPLWLLALIPGHLAASWWLPRWAGGNVEGLFQRLRDGAPESQGRRLLWHNVIELTAQHPWRGWGWGELSFAHYSHWYAGPRFIEILDNAHNLPLHLAVELGVPAALLIVGGLAWMVLGARPWRERDPTRLMAWGLLAVIGLHSLLEYPLWYGPFQMAFGLCLGLLWPAPVRQPANGHAPNGGITRAPAALLSLALMAVVAFAAWEYTRLSQIYLSRDERLPAYRDNTLAKLQGSWLHADSVGFAGLTLTPVTQANAAQIHAMARRALHFSPEPRVIIKLIESAQLLGLNDEALEQIVLFERAFPVDYATWRAGTPVVP